MERMKPAPSRLSVPTVRGIRRRRATIATIAATRSSVSTRSMLRLTRTFRWLAPSYRHYAAHGSTLEPQPGRQSVALAMQTPLGLACSRPSRPEARSWCVRRCLGRTPGRTDP